MKDDSNQLRTAGAFFECSKHEGRNHVHLNTVQIATTQFNSNHAAQRNARDDIFMPLLYATNEITSWVVEI